MKTRSTSEAMDVLSAHRRPLIVYGRYVATEICKARGTVTSRDVRRAMAAMGLLDDDSRELWLGSMFRCGDFEWTGELYTYSDSDRNIHERTIKVWRLVAGAAGHAQPLNTPPFSWAAVLSPTEVW